NLHVAGATSANLWLEDVGDSNKTIKFAADGGALAVYSDATALMSLSTTQNSITRKTLFGSTANPTYMISLAGTAAQTIGVERHPSADPAGNALTVLAGGAASGATDKDGGDLILSSATATGDGMSSIVFKTVLPDQGAGTTDRAPAASMTLASNALTLPS